MTFEEALKAMKEWKKVRRADWIDGAYICGWELMGNSESFLFGDFLAEDWEIYDG